MVKKIWWGWSDSKDYHRDKLSLVEYSSKILTTWFIVIATEVLSDCICHK